jgi:nicotinamidase-related amidase
MQFINLRASTYQQFDADYERAVPGEGYGGWQETRLTLDPAHTAVVVMHAWNHGRRADFPGWYRAVEYIPRSNVILRDVFPPLLKAVRAAGITLFHVGGGGDYYRHLPGYRRAAALAGDAPELSRVPAHPSLEALRQFRAKHVFVGEHNRSDVDRGFAALDFPDAARPLDHEGIAEDAHQLTALCLDAGVNHLIYAGFAVNWCLLMSPGGMVDMSRRGVICSVLRQAVTAVENRESAAAEAHKEEALWRIALAFGFVFDVDDFVAQLTQG